MFGPEFYNQEIPVNNRINIRGEADEPRIQAAHPVIKPTTKPKVDDPLYTNEEEFQASLWRSQITPKPAQKNDGLRGFIARFDKEAQARAAGLGEQRYDEFDGPLPTRDPSLDKLIERYGNKDTNDTMQTELRPNEPVTISPDQPIH